MPVVLPGPRKRPGDPARPSARGRSAMLANALALVAAAVAVPPADAATQTATEPRAYELVSPPAKGSNEIMTSLWSSADGDHVAFMSPGGFADTPVNITATYYAGHRSESGWSLSSLNVPNGSPAPGVNDMTWPIDLSDDLRTAYFAPYGSWTSLDQRQDLNQLDDVFIARDGVTTWITPSLTLPDTTPGTSENSNYGGRSADGRHVVVQSSKQLLPGVPGGVKRVYDYTDGALKLVSILPPEAGSPPDSDAVYGGDRITGGAYNPADERAISRDGSRIYFGRDGQLYVRIDGTRTELISATRRTGDPRGPVADADAEFQGASDDGRVVYFTAAKPLTDDATADMGLYRYDADSDTLALIAQGAAGSILGTVRTAPDGSRTYFASNEALTPNANAGDDNIYVSGPGAGGAPKLVASLPAFSGTAMYGFGEGASTAAISPDGRSLAFAFAASLNNADTGGKTQVYRYNLDAGLTCVSCPADGSTPSARGNLRDDTGNQQSTPRAFTSDGTLIFESGDRLTAGDDDDQVDVYAFDGAPHLVSVGTKTETHVVDNSTDGRDVFLRTRDALVGADVDGGYADIYDARIGGGFPEQAGPQPCSGDACRGPQTPPPAASAAPGSLTAAEDAGAKPAGPVPTTFKVNAISSAARARWASTGSLTLNVRVSDGAEVVAKATHKSGKKRTTVASATGMRASAGTVKLTLRLSTSAKRALKRAGRLTLRLTVTCSDAKAAKRATVVLRVKKKATR